MRSFWSRIVKPRGPTTKWLVFLTLVIIFYLNVSGELVYTRAFLESESLSFTIGETRITAYLVVNFLLTLAVLVWISAMAAEFAENQIGKLSNVRTANKELFIKFAQIAVYVIAAVVGLDLIGLDLTTLTVFGGALGIGLGFGLQKIASNFISGLILLMEKSIEVNDLVELPDGIFGLVRRTGARYTLMETFDNKEILIPNEDFITNRVINWTFSNTMGRVEIPIGVSYDSDLEQVHDILIEAAKNNPRCSTEKEPVCFLRSFSDSSVDFMLFFWVDDVENGRWAPQSEVMLDIWKRFSENNITIPFPQRDLHLRSGMPEQFDQGS